MGPAPVPAAAMAEPHMADQAALFAAAMGGPAAAPQAAAQPQAAAAMQEYHNLAEIDSAAANREKSASNPLSNPLEDQKLPLVSNSTTNKR